MSKRKSAAATPVILPLRCWLDVVISALGTIITIPCKKELTPRVLFRPLRRGRWQTDMLFIYFLPPEVYFYFKKITVCKKRWLRGGQDTKVVLTVPALLHCIVSNTNLIMTESAILAVSACP